jgi:hypothetical protein
MLVTVSQVVVVIVGVVVGVLAIWGTFAPNKLLSLVKSVMNQDFGIYAAVVIRLLLGAALIIAAAGSRFPVIFQALGWIAILAALGLAIIGQKRMRKFVAWFDRFSPALIRLWLLLGIAFGVFLIYGAFGPV